MGLAFNLRDPTPHFARAVLNYCFPTMLNGWPNLVRRRTQGSFPLREKGYQVALKKTSAIDLISGRM